MKKTAITLGDPCGISPEITIKALNCGGFDLNNFVLIGNSKVLDFYAEKSGAFEKNGIEIIEIPYKTEHITPGRESAFSGKFSFSCLEKACELAKSGDISAIVTAPLSKHAMHLAGHDFDGQTEVLEHFLAHDGQKAEMLFSCTDFSVLLLTRHIALKQACELIKKDFIIEKVKRLQNSYEKLFNNPSPKFAICALNPHAGENGLFGSEERDEILPAISDLTASGVNIKGAFPADALFKDFSLDKKPYDCYIALYHDQGLIPLKLAAGNDCVNTTIGLDILRTSPAHGTAFDIAGKNIANPSSMINAIKIALKYPKQLV